MATRLYLRNYKPPANGTLPTAEQGAGTANYTFGAGNGTFLAASLIRGAAQASKTGTTGTGTTQKRAFIGGWVSLPLKQQDIAANNWNFHVANNENNVNARFWINQCNAYIWRPSTGAKVATIYDGSNSASLGGAYPAAAGELTSVRSFSGAAVTGQIQVGDVLVFELWAVHTQGNTTSRTVTCNFDGASTSDEAAADNTTVSDMPSYVETPSGVDLQFSPGITLDPQAHSSGAGVLVANQDYTGSAWQNLVTQTFYTLAEPVLLVAMIHGDGSDADGPFPFTIDNTSGAVWHKRLPTSVIRTTGDSNCVPQDPYPESGTYTAAKGIEIWTAFSATGFGSQASPVSVTAHTRTNAIGHCGYMGVLALRGGPSTEDEWIGAMSGFINIASQTVNAPFTGGNVPQASGSWLVGGFGRTDANTALTADAGSNSYQWDGTQGEINDGSWFAFGRYKSANTVAALTTQGTGVTFGSSTACIKGHAGALEIKRLDTNKLSLSPIAALATTTATLQNSFPLSLSPVAAQSYLIAKLDIPGVFQLEIESVKATSTVSCGLSWNIALAPSAAQAKATVTCDYRLPSIFPIVVSANNRYLQDSYGKPFPIRGIASHGAPGRYGSAAITDLFDWMVDNGFNAFECTMMAHNVNLYYNAGSDADGNHPFVYDTATPTHNTYDFNSGYVSGSTGPDFTYPNESYWVHVDEMMDAALERSILVIAFPSYVGYTIPGPGWMAEMVNMYGIGNYVGGFAGQPWADDTKNGLWNYGAWVANRYKSYPNLIWQLGGDQGTEPNPFDNQTQIDAEQALYDGIMSITGQVHGALWTAEWSSPAIATDQTTFGSLMDINATYVWEGNPAGESRAAWAHSPTIPAWQRECPYDKEGNNPPETGGTSANPNSTQPARRYTYWGLIDGISGYCAGNGYVNGLKVGWDGTYGINSTFHANMTLLNAFWNTLPWWRLIPSGLSGLATLVTNTPNSPTGNTYVVSAATAEGDLLLAYIPPAQGGTITVAMSAMAQPSTRTSRARWWDPTTGNFTDIGYITNTGTHDFTRPTGDHAADVAEYTGLSGFPFHDWLLVLDLYQILQVASAAAKATVSVSSLAVRINIAPASAAAKASTTASLGVQTAIATSPVASKATVSVGLSVRVPLGTATTAAKSTLTSSLAANLSLAISSVQAKASTISSFNTRFALSATAAAKAALTSSFYARVSLALSPILSKAYGIVDQLSIEGGLYELPASRITKWQPGLTYNGGIPTNWPIYNATPLPNGTSLAVIQSTVNAAHTTYPNGAIVLLGEGTFSWSWDSYLFLPSNIILRGAGRGLTILTKTDGATLGHHEPDSCYPNPGGPYVPLILIAPAAGVNWGTPRNLATGLSPDPAYPELLNGAKGTQYVAVDSTGGLSVGQLVEVDCLALEAFVAQDFEGPQRGNIKTSCNAGGTPDWRATYRCWDPPPSGDESGMDCGNDTYTRSISRVIQEMKEIESINGLTIKFTTPLHTNYFYDHTAQIAPTVQGFAHHVGVEDLTLERGSLGNIYMNRAMYCWVQRVESRVWTYDAGVRLATCFRCEVRDSFLHDAAYPVPGGSGYSFAFDGATADCLFENSTSIFANKVMVARACGGGNVVGYNYMDCGFTADNMNGTWVEVGLNGSHFVGCHHVLFEGNHSFNFDSDFTHGASTALTVFRNHLTSFRRAFDTTPWMTNGQVVDDLNGPIKGGPRRCIGTNEYGYYNNYVGNVLGLEGQMVGYVYDKTGASGQSAPPEIWLLGWDAQGSCPYDPHVAQNSIRDGNWDWLDISGHAPGQRWHGLGGAEGDGTPATLPNSLYLTAKPSWFGSNPWPWVDPTTGATYILPAKKAYEDSLAPPEQLELAAVSAKATVSASISFYSKFSVNAVAAKATVTNTVTFPATQQLEVAAIEAKSTVTASLGMRTALTPAAVAAKSTVTDTLKARVALSLSTVAASSYVTGTLTIGAFRELLISPAQARSTVTAPLTARLSFSLTAAASSTVSNRLSVHLPIAGGSARASSAVTARLSFPGEFFLELNAALGSSKATSTLSSFITLSIDPILAQAITSRFRLLTAEDLLFLGPYTGKETSHVLTGKQHTYTLRNKPHG